VGFFDPVNLPCSGLAAGGILLAGSGKVFQFAPHLVDPLSDRVFDIHFAFPRANPAEFLLMLFASDH
jgi:hypothetical protein